VIEKTNQIYYEAIELSHWNHVYWQRFNKWSEKLVKYIVKQLNLLIEIMYIDKGLTTSDRRLVKYIVKQLNFLIKIMYSDKGLTINDQRS